MIDSVRLLPALKAAVTHRSINQARPDFVSQGNTTSSLDGLAGILDWNEIVWVHWEYPYQGQIRSNLVVIGDVQSPAN